MNASDSIEVTRNGLVANLRLCRPKKRNAFDERMVQEISTAVAGLARSEAPPRVVVISGDGEGFCAGADLNWMRRMADFSFEENIADARKLSAMFEAIHTAPFTVISRVHGAALGGGVGLAAVADCVVASESARFAFTEVLLGLRPSTISLYCIPRLGALRSRELFCSGRQFTAAEAKEYGLVDVVCPDEQLDKVVTDQVALAVTEGKRGAKKYRVPTGVDCVVPDIEGSPEMLELIEKVALFANGEGNSNRDDLREFLARDIASARVSEQAQRKMRAFLDRFKSP